ncbi:HPr(Ser) kinase/phosphatase [Clostridium sediminicola]|uniref:HPr(Ser) kinase/phosphatase n=1 Tax=Clostridium sediminicola TaxID=3114879 RepID=UPI0031F1F1EB
MSVNIEKLVKDLDLEVVVKGEDNVQITVADVNRPGLQLAGFYNYYANERVQVIGKAEWSFLDTMQLPIRRKRLRKFFKFRTPCVVFNRDLPPHDEVIENATETKTWILRSNMATTKFISKTMSYLEKELAPELRMHGVLADVYGIGILIVGESGIGKSETALELIKRGHRLVADDAVDIKEVDGKLHGGSPYITKGMMEVRGMGIIDVPSLYGLSSVLDEKDIDFIIYLEQWKQYENYDRLGIDNEYMEILNVPVKKIRIPIRPGRNVAVIIEAAAANYRYSLNSKESPVDTIDRRMREVIELESKK